MWEDIKELEERHANLEVLFRHQGEDRVEICVQVQGRGLAEGRNLGFVSTELALNAMELNATKEVVLNPWSMDLTGRLPSLFS